MNRNHNELTRILEILKQNPRGMSVTQLAEAMGMNRISVARYLDILRTSGQVDMEPYGQAKVYYLSQRVPISAMLNLSSEYVVVLGKDQRIVQANTNFVNLFTTHRDEIVDQHIQDILFPENPKLGLQQLIDQAIDGEEIVEEIRIIKEKEELFFKMKVVPTAFTDGSPGITIILEDITEYKRSLEALMTSEEKYKALLRNISELLVKVEYMANLNDQIRNPLQVIVGIADLEDEKLAEQIRDQAQEIDTIIQQLNIGWVESENIRSFFRKYSHLNEESEEAAKTVLSGSQKTKT
ncbi:MAG: PAS domain-containing protein [Methanomicrobiales archaeon]|nr:PAS domain-containing protein [Methanomicrobiales archaeon]